MDINAFREEKGGDPELIRESQRRRFASTEVVDEVILLDDQWRKSRYECDQANKAFAALNKKIAECKKSGADASEHLSQSEGSKKRVSMMEECEKRCKLELDEALCKVGNVVHQSVPVSNDEKDNEVVRQWGECKRGGEGMETHDVLLKRIDGLDAEHGAIVAGHRGYFLKGMAVMLNQALINYALSFLRRRQYELLQTPFFLNKQVMSKVAQLSQFDEELYKVTGDGEEKYLIATSEQPIAALHIGEWLDPKWLPLRYGGYSTCFRKEAGAHGRDVAGIFRVHQFEKVEQFVITSPEESWEMHEKMVGIAEEFYKSLELPYRVVNIVSGELNLAAAKKYDIECWYPGSGSFREVVSCSNCTDYQSRRLDIRFGTKKLNQKSKQYVHMLNSTLCATGRVLCCLLENGQREEGIEVPLVLQPFLLPFMDDPTILPYVKNK